jgi:hypothetical protein
MSCNEIRRVWHKTEQSLRHDHLTKPKVCVPYGTLIAKE